MKMINPYIELAQHYKSSIDEDTYRHNRNQKQLENLRSHPRINIDKILAGENEDDRLGCCIVARPTENIKSLISSIQHKLLESIPKSSALWHSPSEYLHMTVLEIDNSSTKNRIKEIATVLLPHIDRIMTIANTGPELSNPLICFDANAIALSFTSVDRSHIEYRLELYDSIVACGVDIRPRYHTPSAHITITRFVEEIRNEDLMALIAQIKAINGSLVDTKWKISHCEYNYGLIWYGQRLQHV